MQGGWLNLVAVLHSCLDHPRTQENSFTCPSEFIPELVLPPSLPSLPPSCLSNTSAPSLSLARAPPQPRRFLEDFVRSLEGGTTLPLLRYRPRLTVADGEDGVVELAEARAAGWVVIEAARVEVEARRGGVDAHADRTH